MIMTTYRIIQSALVAGMAVCLLPVAQAQTTEEEVVFYTGRYQKSSGILRIIQDPIVGCKQNETMIQWNQVGPQGLKGDTGAMGATGATGPQGPAGPPALKADGPCYNDNTNRYQDCGNGTVTDTVTGLIWLRQTSCILSLWMQANQAAAALAEGECGLSDSSSAGDWRLPTKEEFETTIDRANDLNCDILFTDMTGSVCYSTGSPPFTVLPGRAWSSTSDASDPGSAWTLNPTQGLISTNKAWKGSVWPVRGGR
jgi:hypothetical protein